MQNILGDLVECETIIVEVCQRKRVIDILAPGTLQPYRIMDCRPSPPEGWTTFVNYQSTSFGETDETLRARFLCAAGTQTKETGQRFYLSAPLPPGGN